MGTRRLKRTAKGGGVRCGVPSAHEPRPSAPRNASRVLCVARRGYNKKLSVRNCTFDTLHARRDTTLKHDTLKRPSREGSPYAADMAGPTEREGTVYAPICCIIADFPGILNPVTDRHSV